jgi:hypothetical protein
MSAMKMDFICKESPEKEGPAPVAAARLSALLNGARDSDVDMDGASSGRNTPDPAAAALRSETPTHWTDRDGADRNGVSDDENSEDDQAEHAAWQDVDLNPAVDLVRTRLAVARRWRRDTRTDLAASLCMSPGQQDCP